MTGFIAVDMLSEISNALEYENDWTQLKDGVLECRLRDQYDGEHTGLARVTVDKAGKVSVMAWSDNPYEYAASRSLRTCSRSRGARDAFNGRKIHQPNNKERKHTMLFKLEIGDYSEDGYGVHEPVIYETNYDVAAIAEGYRKSCKKYGIQFNRGDNDFTGLGLKCWDKRALWSNPDMGACWLDEKMHDLLTHTGVVPEEDMMSLEGEYLANYDSGPDEYANAIMRFIALSMPDDFTYRIQEPENIPCLNDTLGVNLGYGLLVP